MNSILRRPRGGARNSAGRESYYLDARQVGELIEAAKQATQIGCPLNRFISIHWELAGIESWEMPRATRAFTDRLRKTLKRHGSETAWVYVHENSCGTGWHCHFLAHVPPHLITHVQRLQRGWIKAITGQSYRKGVISSSAVGRRVGLETSNPELWSVNMVETLGYMLKAANDEARRKYGLSRPPQRGMIVGKRCGTSQNIGQSARSKYCIANEN